MDDDQLKKEAQNKEIKKKLELVAELYSFSMALKLSELKRKYPEKEESELKKEAQRLIESAAQ